MLLRVTEIKSLATYNFGCHCGSIDLSYYEYPETGIQEMQIYRPCNCWEISTHHYFSYIILTILLVYENRSDLNISVNSAFNRHNTIANLCLGDEFLRKY